MPPLARRGKAGSDLTRAQGRRARKRWVAPKWTRTVLRHKLALSVGAATLLLGGSVAWAWNIGFAGALQEASADLAARALVGTQVAAGLVVRDVTVEGREETAANDLLAALGVQRGDLLLDFDAEAARARIEELGWIREAMVSRLLPDRIHVEVTERVPFALWQNDRKLMLIDRDGEVITDKALGRFSSLPMIVGRDAAPLAGSLMDMLAQQPGIRQRVRAAVRVGGRRWDIHFDNGVIAKLPEENAASAWTRLADLDTQYRVLDRVLLSIDLRLADRLVLGLEPPPPPPPKAPARGNTKGRGA
jgi:cell division protein FtsQ